VVECPDGTTVVVDGGNRTWAVDYGESVVTPYLLHAADTDIEHVVMTHVDMDHSGGLPYVLRSVGAARVVGVSNVASQGLASAVRVAGRAAGAVVGHGAGVTLHSSTVRGQPLSIEVVYPRAAGDVDVLDEDANADSLVLLVRYGAFRALLTADIEAGVEAFLAQAVHEGWLDVSAHVLKAPHHGSDTSSTPRFLAAVDPELTVISAGAGNRHGHPAPPVLARYKDAGARVLRTDHHGAVTIATHGRSCWVRTAAR
jgi:competence protein ComEC